MTRRHIAVILIIAAGVKMTLRASDNVDFDINGEIHDTIWDSRLFDGTPGFAGAIRWFHNPAGMPSYLNQGEVEAAVQTSFNTWQSVDDGIPETPVIPPVTFGGQTTVADAFALDGVNVIAWQAEFPGGTLAVTPCWALDLPTTTTTDAQGQTVMPVEGGSIPFPGPPGVTPRQTCPTLMALTCNRSKPTRAGSSSGFRTRRSATSLPSTRRARRCCRWPCQATRRSERWKRTTRRQFSESTREIATTVRSRRPSVDGR